MPLELTATRGRQSTIRARPQLPAQTSRLSEIREDVVLAGPQEGVQRGGAGYRVPLNLQLKWPHLKYGAEVGRQLWWWHFQPGGLTQWLYSLTGGLD